jgi:hypothetical protein
MMNVNDYLPQSILLQIMLNIINTKLDPTIKIVLCDIKSKQNLGFILAQGC